MKFNKIVLLMGIIFYSTMSLADEIKLAADLWCPYNCDPKSTSPGFMIEIMKEVFEKSGHTINYEVVNWARAILEARDNKYNGIVGAAKDDAPDFVFASTPTAFSSNHFWVIKDNSWQYKNQESLKGKKIGVINSYSYGDDVDKEVQSKNPSYKVISGDNALSRIIEMTYAKRLDAFVENPFVLEYFLKDKPNLKGKFKKGSANITKNSDLFIAFSPNNPKSKLYAETLSKGMDELRKNGKLKFILNKYGLKDWK